MDITLGVITANYGNFAYPGTGIVTVLAVAVYFLLTWNVGKARRQFHIAPPETNGPPDFLRVVRAHANTAEQMVLFLPVLWLTAASVGDGFAAVIGIFWPISRIMYAYGYYREAKRRFPGFLLGLLVSSILLISALAGIAAAL